MTAPTDEKTPNGKTSLLGRIFGKVQRAPEPPAGLEDRLSYTDKVGSNGTDAAYWWEGDVPDLGDDYFPSVPDQDKILVHYDRPPADQNPQDWWDDRNIWAKQQRDSIEKQDGKPEKAEGGRTTQYADDPRWNPPEVKRWTAFLNPMGYSFLRPFGQDTEKELNGVHWSLADNRRAYILGGSVGQMNAWNNSYRIDPVTNDATAVFVGDTVANDLSTYVTYTNDSAGVRPQRSNRLM